MFSIKNFKCIFIYVTPQYFMVLLLYKTFMAFTIFIYLLDF